ncbi:MAG: hypothetical protein AB7V25_02435 [Mangrovibacterium sp.]
MDRAFSGGYFGFLHAKHDHPQGVRFTSCREVFRDDLVDYRRIFIKTAMNKNGLNIEVHRFACELSFVLLVSGVLILGIGTLTPEQI